MNEETTAISGARLRIGVIFIVLWWAPFWALSPAIAEATGIKTSVVTTTIVIIQTIFGFLGVWVAGKQVSTITKQIPKKQVPKKVWHVLLTGKIDS